MNEFATATEAANPDLYRETLEAQRVAQREHTRLEIVLAVMRAEIGMHKTAAELVAAAKAIEEFVIAG